MPSQAYVEGLKYRIDDAINYYRVCKQKSYSGMMLRINMGCDIYPRHKNFWDFEADKTTTVIDKYIYEIAVYDGNEARIAAVQSKEKLENIAYQCDAYRWYEERRSGVGNKTNNEKQPDTKQVEEDEWNAEKFAIGIDYLSSLRQD